ncbi:MAG: hypothetical protein EBS37_13380 [Betaproteobacteria bacterium]|nr:hypothetical protein [Betaproteobacteria bacterium]
MPSLAAQCLAPQPGGRLLIVGAGVQCKCDLLFGEFGLLHGKTPWGSFARIFQFSNVSFIGAGHARTCRVLQAAFTHLAPTRLAFFL